jgi:hypothetical protein
MTRIEKNKLLMEFMGIKPYWSPILQSWQWSDSPWVTTSNPDKEKVWDSMADYVKFDKKWDGWLVPLVRRIFQVGDDSYDNLVGDVTHQLIDLNTEGLFDACVNFVIEFNARKNGLPKS